MLSKPLIRRQRGVTAIGWLIILGLIAFFTLLALRIVPMYMEYFGVVSIAEKVANEPQIKMMRRSEIGRKITSMLDMNNIENVTEKDFKIEKKSGKMTIGFEYEVRAPMFKQIGIVGHFSHTVEVGAN